MAGKTTEQGAATTCYVATSPALGSVSGEFFEDCQAVSIEDEGHIHNGAMADRLLETSIELTQDWLVEFREPKAEDFKLRRMDQNQ